MASIFRSLRTGLPFRGLSTCAAARRATRSDTQLCNTNRSYIRSQSLYILLTKRYCSTSAIMTKPTADSGDDFRLPLDVKPTHYDLTVKTDLENSKFEGVVKIEYVYTRGLFGKIMTIDQSHQARCQEGNIYHHLQRSRSEVE